MKQFITHHAEKAAVIVLLGLALWLRLTGLAWDEYHHYHPDERYIAWVATTVEWPTELNSAFDPHATTLNPFYWPTANTTTRIGVPRGEPREFAYGHLPLYMGVAAVRMAEWVRPLWPTAAGLWGDLLNTPDRAEFDHVAAVGRALTAVIDVATIWVIYRLGRHLYSAAVGVLAAALLTVNVMHIQLAHFFTTDPYTTFFVTAALAAFVTAVLRQQKKWLYAGAVLVGLAVGSKFSAILLLLPLGLTVHLLGMRGWRPWAAVGLAAVAAFVLTNPFAVLDTTCQAFTLAFRLAGWRIPPVNVRFCYLQNVGLQSAMVRGDTAFPFTRQYEGTWPFLYFIEMQGRWGMGWLLATAALGGLGWQMGRMGQAWRTKRPLGRTAQAELILLVWVVPYLLSTGNFYVKFMRYLQPITPLLMLWAAWALWQLPRRWRTVGTAAVLGTAALYAFAFQALYAQPHPWVTASVWLHTHAAEGSVVASELWDEPLPSTVVVDGRTLGRNRFGAAELPWLSQVGGKDTEARVRQNLAILAEADYLVVASNRVYGVLPRLPNLYPLSHAFHQQLFDGRLGYDVVFVVDRTPRLFGLAVYPDTFAAAGLRPPAAVADYLAQRPGWAMGRADESFTVYDQPLTMIFVNEGRLTADEMWAVLVEE